MHRRRSGWNSEGDAWRAPAAAEGGSVPNGMGYGEECPLSSRLGVWGSVMSSHSGVRGRAPAENGCWCILKATERSFLYLYDKNLRGTICTSVPYSKFYAHVAMYLQPQTVHQHSLTEITELAAILGGMLTVAT